MPDRDRKFRNTVLQGKWREMDYSYIGQVNSKGQWHGYGILVNKFGFIHENYWRKGKREGKGREIGVVEGWVVESEWKNDEENGMSVEKYDNGYEWRGEYKDGKWHGWWIERQSGVVCARQYKEGKEVTETELEEK